MRKLTKEEWIEKALLVHGDWYDYSKVVYMGARTKVCIICPIHGEFWQLPSIHLSGQGCPHCGFEKRKKNRKKSQEQLIKDFKEVHGDWYDYSKVEYINNRTKVLIICPIHGEFWQTPNKHLSGRGCPKCANRNVTNEEFIEKVVKKHGDWYDYSKVEYTNAYTKVCIICPIHGEFWQTPDIHLSGCGCPYCKASKLEMFVNKILNENNINFMQNYRGIEWLTTNIDGGKKNRLELDFYLPEHNVGIECQGVQHFESIEYWGGQEGLEYLQNNDKLKLDLCNKHNLRLYYINYNDNIEEKLNEILGIINGR
jgi:glutaredoxin